MSVSVFRGWISWRFSLSKNNISPAVPDFELILFPLWYWPIMNAHTKQQQDKVFETDFIDSQKSDPTFVHLLALSLYIDLCLCVSLLLCVCVYENVSVAVPLCVGVVCLHWCRIWLCPTELLLVILNIHWTNPCGFIMWSFSWPFMFFCCQGKVSRVSTAQVSLCRLVPAWQY